MRSATLKAISIKETVQINCNALGKPVSATMDLFFPIEARYETVEIPGRITIYGKQIEQLTEVSPYIIVSGDFAITKCAGGSAIEIDNGAIVNSFNMEGEINLVNVVGHVRREIDHHCFENGRVAKFSLVMRGKNKDESHWANVETWGQQAQIVGSFVKRNDQVAFSGKLKASEYNGKFYVNIRADRFTLLGAGNKVSEPTTTQPAAKSRGSSQPAYQVDDF